VLSEFGESAAIFESWLLKNGQSDLVTGEAQILRLNRQGFNDLSGFSGSEISKYPAFSVGIFISE
jgi:hypothetical protein